MEGAQKFTFWFRVSGFKSQASDHSLCIPRLPSLWHPRLPLSYVPRLDRGTCRDTPARTRRALDSPVKPGRVA
ncbi:MAG: hypothetical protein Tsb0010_13920 [Parvularculaceae bacterium]